MLKNTSRKLNKFIKYFNIIGLINTFKILIGNKLKNKLFSLQINGFKQKIFLRPNTSDISTFEQIFIRKDYEIDIDFEPKLIIDGGAYIGLSAVYFTNRFNNAKIIAIEPAKSNIELFKKNTENYDNVTLIKAALWSQSKALVVKDVGLGEWGYLVNDIVKNDEDTIQGVTIDELLKNSRFPYIDILKLDIEGSEVELFTQNYGQWLGKVKVLIIELHESIKPGCSKVFFNSIKGYDFSHSFKGENEILIKNTVL